jgi:isoleucyl-tRNA synthetase
VRISVLKTLENLRQNGIIKHSLEAKVILAMNKSHEQNRPLLDLLNSIQASGQIQEQFLKEYFIISACEIIDIEDIEDQDFELFSDCLESDSVLLVKAGHADGIKCPRCWQWEVTDQEHGLCSRCQATITVQ